MFFRGVTLFEFFSNGRYCWISLPKCIRCSILPFDIPVAFLYIAQCCFPWSYVELSPNMKKNVNCKFCFPFISL